MEPRENGDTVKVLRLADGETVVLGGFIVTSVPPAAESVGAV